MNCRIFKSSIVSAMFATSLFAFAPKASAGDSWFQCVPLQVVEIVGSRVHVQCSNSIVLNGNTVSYVSVSTTNASVAARFMATANQAFLSGKRFWAAIPTASTTNISGCSAADCRTPSQFGLGN